MLVYRVQPSLYATSCLTGEGARRTGGRWNFAGTPLVYAATTPELALLENLVHLDGTPSYDLPPQVLITIRVPDELLLTLPLEELPLGWNQLLYPSTVPEFLLPWLVPAHPVLGWLVPSAVLPASPSRCALLNPLHRRAAELQILRTESIILDARLRPAPVG